VTAEYVGDARVGFDALDHGMKRRPLGGEMRALPTSGT
jgi:hypothetical protein